MIEDLRRLDWMQVGWGVGGELLFSGVSAIYQIGASLCAWEIRRAHNPNTLSCPMLFLNNSIHMNPTARFTQAKRLPRKLRPKTPKPRPAPEIEKEEALPCAELLRLISELHLGKVTATGTPPRLPAAVIPGNYGEKQHLPRHGTELRTIEGYHIGNAPHGCGSSNSNNSLQISLHSVSLSPEPAKRRKRLPSIRRVQQSSPYFPAPVRKSLGSKAFLTAKSDHSSASPPLRTASTYGFSQSPEPQSATKSIQSYDGEYLGGLRHGEGSATYVNGDYYTGAWAEGYRYGYGEFFYQAVGVTFKGDWLDDLKTGSGVAVFSNGDSLECRWSKDVIKDSTATIHYSKSKSEYEGGIKQACKHGEGSIKYRDGTIYRGDWVSEKRHGPGLLHLPDGLFEGLFSHDSAQGPGLLFLKSVLFLRPEVNPATTVAAKPSEKETLLGDLADFFHFAYSSVVTAADVVWKAISLSDLQTRIGPVDGGFDGSFINGVLNGAGVVLYGSFGCYEGILKEGKRSGIGKMTYKNPKFQCLNLTESEGVYMGKWRNDERHGFGLMHWKSGLVYEGQFIRDHRHRVQGTLALPSGERYDGEWQHGLMHGQARYQNGRGTTFTGEFVSGHPIRTGELSLPDGSYYKGEILDMQPGGKGTQTFSNGDTYIGDFQNGKRHGKGTMTYFSGVTYVGDWRSGLREGSGVLRSAGETYSGLWRKDQQHGAGQLATEGNGTLVGTWNQGTVEGVVTLKPTS